MCHTNVHNYTSSEPCCVFNLLLSELRCRLMLTSLNCIALQCTFHCNNTVHIFALHRIAVNSIGQYCAQLQLQLHNCALGIVLCCTTVHCAALFAGNKAISQMGPGMWGHFDALPTR